MKNFKMKRFIPLILILFIINRGFAQNKIVSHVLSESETEDLFSEELKSDLGLIYPVKTAYTYKDKSGEYLLVLTEREYKKEKEKTFCDTIIGINYKKQGTGYRQVWYMRDFILKRNDSNTPEFSVWYWTKYLDLKDFNKDGLIEPVIVYGTSGNDGLDDGRVKILIYYKGEKYAIRHQNGPYDMQRYTTVDAAFYNLPKQVQSGVINIMDKIEENGHAIFAHSYRKQMSKKKTRFDDVHYDD